MKKTPTIDFITLLAARLHESWRRDFQKENGRETPIWAFIKDEEYIGVLDPDDLPPYISMIAEKYVINTNINYVYLSPDWKRENYAIACLVKELILRIESGEALKDREIGEFLHERRILRARRNEQVMNPMMRVEYAELPLTEQIKYLNQFVLGVSAYEELSGKAIKKVSSNPVLDRYFQKYGTTAGYTYNKDDMEYRWQMDTLQNALKQKKKEIQKENAFGEALRKSINELTKKFGISVEDLDAHLQAQIAKEREKKH